MSLSLHDGVYCFSALLCVISLGLLLESLTFCFFLCTTVAISFVVAVGLSFVVAAARRQAGSKRSAAIDILPKLTNKPSHASKNARAYPQGQVSPPHPGGRSCSFPQTRRERPPPSPPATARCRYPHPLAGVALGPLTHQQRKPASAACPIGAFSRERKWPGTPLLPPQPTPGGRRRHRRRAFAEGKERAGVARVRRRWFRVERQWRRCPARPPRVESACRHVLRRLTGPAPRPLSGCPTIFSLVRRRLCLVRSHHHRRRFASCYRRFCHRRRRSGE